MKLRGIAAVLFLIMPAAAGAAGSNAPSKEIEAKIALESSMEKRLQTVLRGALGSDDLLVIVNVALLSEDSRSDPDVMPGLPAKQSAGLSDALGLTLPMVSRLSATIIVDQSTDEKDLELVKKVAAGILGISPERGDSLSVEKIKFHKPAPAKPDPLHYFTVGSSALWLVFAVVALAMIQKKFLAPLIGQLRDISAAVLVRTQSPDQLSNVSEAPVEEPPEKNEAPFAASTNGHKPQAPFSFINDSDHPKLAYILRNSSAKVTATVIQYLPPRSAAKIMASLSPELRQQVVALYSKVSELEEGQVKPLEDTMRKRIEYMMGGEDKLAEILDALPFTLQKELLETLNRMDPPLAQRLAQALVFIDDLANLEPAELKLLSRKVPAKLLATVLRSSEQLKNSVLPKLAAGTREWLTQEMELSSELSPAVLQEACEKVLAAVSQLVREGRIVLRKKPPQPKAA